MKVTKDTIVYLYHRNITGKVYTYNIREIDWTEQQLISLDEDSCTMVGFLNKMVCITKEHPLLVSNKPEDIDFNTVLRFEASNSTISHKISAKDNKIENLTWVTNK